MGKPRLGFDLGSSSMKIALLRDDRVVRLEEIRLPENLVDENGCITLPHAFIQFLKQTRKELSLPRVPAALVLPPSQAICRLVTMPHMTTDQLFMNLPYEFTDFIQGVADQYFCDYAVCQSLEGEEENGLPMMAAVASKDALAQYVRMFSQAGVRLKTILPQEMALIQLAQAQKAEECCFVDLGHQFTRITVVWRDRVQATRQIGVGGRNLDLLVADELGVGAFLAGTYKIGNYRDILSSPGVADVCEHIAVEILKVINFYQFTYRSSTLEGVYLVGGGAAIPALRKAIADVAGVELLEPETLLPGAQERAAAGVFAAGAAMGGVK